MSQTFIKVFGDLLMKHPLSKYPITDPNGYYPPPVALLRKILIKGTQSKLGPKTKPVVKQPQGGFINRSRSRIAELTVDKIKDSNNILGKDEEKGKHIMNSIDNQHCGFQINCSMINMLKAMKGAVRKI